MCASVCACAYGCGRLASAQNCCAVSVGIDRVRFGLQAFQSASAFNANIGAWNTASVTSLYGVCVRFCRVYIYTGISVHGDGSAACSNKAVKSHV